MAHRLMNTHGIKAFMEVYKLSGSMLPIMSETLSSGSVNNMSLDKTHPNANFTIDSTPQGHIHITFPYRFKDDSIAIFSLLSGQTSPSLLMDDFPTEFVCNISTSSGHSLLEINYKANLEHGLPESHKLIVNTGAFEIKSDLKTSFRKKNSHMQLSFSMTENMKKRMDFRMISSVGLDSDQRIHFGRKKMSLEAFPIVIDLRGERGFHTYNPQKFVKDFNIDNQIFIYDQKMNLLGELRLSERPDQDYINPIVRLGNGTEFEIEALMRSVKQLLRLKLRNL